MSRVFALFAMGISLTLIAPGCGDDEGDVGEEFTDETVGAAKCAEICGKYSECVTDIDVSECTDRCEDSFDADPAMEEAAEACEDCISDRSCDEISAAGCFNNCPVVPGVD